VASPQLVGRAPVAPVASDQLLARLRAQRLDRLPVDLTALADAEPPAARHLEDSARPIEADSPEALVSGTLEAIAAGDLLALARALRGPEGALTEDDTAAAELRFLAPSARAFWARVARAVEDGDVDWIDGEQPDEAWLVANVGGAAGSYRIRLRREGETWVLAS